METLQQQKTLQKAAIGSRSRVSDAAISHPSRTIVHAKLEMTEPGDHDEQEADAVANDIVNGGKIHRKISNGGGSGISVSPQVESQIAQLQGGGHAMPAGLRNMMENGFGRDFSQVRLHTDSQAADISSSISARAFTHGNDIYFNRGQFSPNTSEGQRLVAHELTHVAQGTGKVGRKETTKTYQTEDVINFGGYASNYICSENNSSSVYLILYGAGYTDIETKGHDQGKKNEESAKVAESIIKNGSAKVKIGSAIEEDAILKERAKNVVADKDPEIEKKDGYAYVIKKEIAGESFESRFNKDSDFVEVKPTYDSGTFFYEINKFAEPNSPKISFLSVYAHGFFDDYRYNGKYIIDFGINLGGRMSGVNGASKMDEKADTNMDTHCLVNGNLIPAEYNVFCPENTSDELTFHSGRQVNITNYKNIKPEAFQKNATIYLWGCNHGGFNNIKGIDGLLKEHIKNGVEVYGFDSTTISPTIPSENPDGHDKSIINGEMLGNYGSVLKTMQQYKEEQLKNTNH